MSRVSEEEMEARERQGSYIEDEDRNHGGQTLEAKRHEEIRFSAVLSTHTYFLI